MGGPSPETVEVRALPAGSWFLDREPAFTVTGPSALVSWLEPQILMLHWRIQMATRALSDDPDLAAELAVVSTEREREIIEQTFAAIGKPAPAGRPSSPSPPSREHASASRP